MKKATGATPLAALDAVAIDTETTGLKVQEARIIQFGAVAMQRGRLEPTTALDLLVNPQVPIPPSSTEVHGINDAMVDDKPPYPEAYARFLGWCGDRPMIGYSIGFDLAVMEHECTRHGIDWQKPRTLCVRILGTIANPDLPDNALDTIAAWLGIEIRDRHNAVGDAVAAGRVFVELLPHLKKRGIRTLAEAERACLRMTSEIESHQRAGWAQPATAPGTGRAMAKVDPYVYRYRVGDLMSAPPMTIPASSALKSAIETMTDKKISSVFVSETGEAGGPLADYRILTERDVMRKIAADGARAFELPAGDCASGPLASIPRDAFVYRAIGRMDRLRIRHLAVEDQNGMLLGAVSARDLLKLRAGAAISLDDSIHQAASAAEMAAAWATLPEVAGRLVGEELEARTIAEIISDELRAMTARAAELAEAAMRDEGLGKPPCRYAVLVLGSGGRGESLLAADQDNAIIYDRGDPDGPEDRWFASLGERIARTLDEAAISLCKGGIMAMNADWRGNTELWRRRIADWVRRASPADLLNVDIVFDLVPVYGDLTLGLELFEAAFEIGRSHVPFAKLLAAQLENRENPFTLLGQFKTENGRMDLKKFGLFPIVAGARALAIRHDVRQRSTARRLRGLIEMDIGGDSDMQAILRAHEVILSLMLRQQSRDLASGVPVSNHVELATLDREQQRALKDALKRIQIIPDLVRDLLFA